MSSSSPNPDNIPVDFKEAMKRTEVLHSSSLPVLAANTEKKDSKLKDKKILSRVAQDFFITQNDWTISYLVHIPTQGKSFGHAQLMVEGIKNQDDAPEFFESAHDGEFFVGFYDIVAEPLEEKTSFWNTVGYIKEVRCEEYKEHERKKNYNNMYPKVFFVSSKHAKAMIKSIKTERTEIQQGKQVPYEFVGIHSILGSKGRGINCANWCGGKLKIAKIDVVFKKPRTCLIL